MDVRDLAPALLALSSLIDQINNRLNGAEKPVTMQFKSTSKGSLIAHLQLATTWVQDVIGLFASPTGQNLKLVMDTLWGGGIATAGVGLFQLIKFLRGSLPTKVEQGPSNTIIVYNINGDFITTNLGTLELSQDTRIKIEAARVVRPLEKDGVDTFAITQGEVPVNDPITKEDLPAFMPEQSPNMPDEVSVIILQLVHPDLTDSDAKWRFTDGNKPFNAAITDEDFIARFRARKIRVGHGDALRVELVTRQSFEAQKLRTEYEVQKVLNFYEGGLPKVQGNIFPPTPE